MTAQAERHKNPKNSWVRNVKPVPEGGDPVRDLQHETLAKHVRAAIDGHGQLDSLIVFRREGQQGWQPTEFSISPNPEIEDLDEDAAASELLVWIDSHTTAEGPADYQIRGIGLNSRGNPTTLFSLHIPRGGSTKSNSAAEIEGGDILRSAKEMISALTNTNTTLLANMERIGEQAVRGYQAAQQASQTLVDLERVKLEFESKRIEREFEDREAEREAKLSSERMEHGLGMVQMVADGFIARENRRAAEASDGKAPTINRGDTIKAGLRKIFDGLTPEQQSKAREAVGDDVWDLFQSALQAGNADERKAIVRKIVETWESWPIEIRKQKQQVLVDAIGPGPASSLMMLLKTASA